MLNIEKYKKEVIARFDTCQMERMINDITGFNYCGSAHDHCTPCAEYVYKWLLSEYKEPILNDAEREYLSAVIKPFRDKVKFIKLPSYDCLNLIYTCIRMYDNCGNEIVRLPNFKIGTMYKGMKIDKNYTPEELCL